MRDLKSKIIAYAKEIGADIIGFSSIERFTDTPLSQDPLRIFPQAKSVIGLGFRILRGSTRGVEEGSTYYQYTTMAIENIEENIIPTSLLRMAAFVEDMGYEAVPQRSHRTIMAEKNSTNPEIIYDKIFRGVELEVQMDFRHAAIACGMGEIGLSGQILTADYGPYQRFCFILTNAELEPDPIESSFLCDKCGECIDACPGSAFADTEDIVLVDNNEYKVHNIDSWQCAVYYNGANRSKNPFMPSDVYADIPEREAVMKGKIKLSPDMAKDILDRTIFYPPCRHCLAISICARACDRACYNHLEKENKLHKKFKNKFSKREEWILQS